MSLFKAYKLFTGGHIIEFYDCRQSDLKIFLSNVKPMGIEFVIRKFILNSCFNIFFFEVATMFLCVAKFFLNKYLPNFVFYMLKSW